MEQHTSASSMDNYKYIGHDELRIRGLLDDYVEALKAKDLDRIMAFYTEDVVAFDLQPPLQFVGKDSYRRAWKMIEPFSEPIKFEMTDLAIAVGDDVAFGHSLDHFIGTMSSGEEIDCWTRHTVGLKKINGSWKIAHESVSVPINKDGKAMFELRP